VGVAWWRRNMVKTVTNQNGESQNGDMPKQRQTNDLTARASSRILHCGHSTQYSHLVLIQMTFTSSVDFVLFLKLQGSVRMGACMVVWHILDACWDKRAYRHRHTDTPIAILLTLPGGKVNTLLEFFKEAQLTKRGTTTPVIGLITEDRSGRTPKKTLAIHNRRKVNKYRDENVVSAEARLDLTSTDERREVVAIFYDNIYMLMAEPRPRTHVIASHSWPFW